MKKKFNDAGFEVIKHSPRCTCGGDNEYNAQFDAYYCPTCDHWLETECGCNSDCMFKGRPEKPSML